jgi:hypothetical protein
MEEFHKKNKLVVRPIDMQTRMPNGNPVIPRPEQTDALISLVSVGYMKAYRRASPLEWATKESMFRKVTSKQIGIKKIKKKKNKNK